MGFLNTNIICVFFYSLFFLLLLLLSLRMNSKPEYVRPSSAKHRELNGLFCPLRDQSRGLQESSFTTLQTAKNSSKSLIVACLHKCISGHLRLELVAPLNTKYLIKYYIHFQSNLEHDFILFNYYFEYFQ